MTRNYDIVFNGTVDVKFTRKRTIERDLSKTVMRL